MLIIRHAKTHLPKFALYLISGLSATGLNYGSYLFILNLEIYYVTASFISEIIGFFSAFLLHKYFVFQKKGNMASHFVRYLTLGIFNTIAISTILFISVEYMGIPEEIGKLIGIGTVVIWNFFFYKFFVYID
jgi:putative flippase GtrA